MNRRKRKRLQLELKNLSVFKPKSTKSLENQQKKFKFWRLTFFQCRRQVKILGGAKGIDDMGQPSSIPSIKRIKM